MTSVFMIILLWWSRPLESKFATCMETFNEVITLFTLYLLLCFSEFVPDPKVRNECGKAFIAVIILYAAVHIYFLIADVLRQLRHTIRKKYYERRNKKLMAKRAYTRETAKVSLSGRSLLLTDRKS